MELQVLGPMRLLVHEEAFEVRGGKQRGILAVLAAHRGAAVSSERLLDEVWGGDGGAPSMNALQAQVSQLRKVLGSSAIVHRSGGYALELPPGALDAERFERWASDGIDHVMAGRPEAGARLLRQALDLWRGPAFGDAAELLAVQPAAAHLEGLRLAAEEQRLAAELALGRHQIVIGDLTRLAHEHPLAEGIWKLLILALYRSGRQAEALRAYAEVRNHLVEDLGVEPGAELRELEARVLAQDPSLEADQRVPASQHRSRVAKTGNLVRPLSSFVGRGADISEVVTLVRDHRLVTLLGPGGVGKTRLAVEAAFALAAEQPDGAWFVDLAEVIDPAAVPAALADALAQLLGGVDGPRGPHDPVDALVEQLSDRELLVVLDNCEHLVGPVGGPIGDVVRELVGRVAGLRVLATSREALGVAGETRRVVDPLPEADAQQLFVDRARSVDASCDPAREAEALEELCRRLDGLPLAIELAAARVRTLQLSEILVRLDDRFSLLSGERHVVRRHQALHTVVSWSRDQLGEAERLLFDRLSVFTGGFALDAAEDVCGTAPLAREQVLDLLGVLVDTSLVRVERTEHGAVRYHLLQTLTDLGREHLSEAESDELLDRHAEWFVTLASGALEGLRGAASVEWRARLTADLGNLRAAFAHLIERGDEAAALALATGLGGFWFLRADWHEAIRWFDEALALGVSASTQALRTARARAESWRTYFASISGGMPDHLERSRAALAVVEREVTDPSVVSEALLLHASACAHGVAFDEALGALDRAHDQLVRAGHRWGLGMEQLLRTNVLMGQGRVDEAVVTAQEAIDRFEAVGEAWMQMEPLGSLAAVADVRGDLDEAARVLERALASCLAMDLPSYVGPWMFFLGRVRWRQGRIDDARSLFDEALAVARTDVVTANALVGRARVALRDTDLDLADRLLTEARRLTRDHHALPPRAAASVASGWLALDLGRPREATEAARVADATIPGCASVLRAAIAEAEGRLDEIAGLLADAAEVRATAPVIAALDDHERARLGLLSATSAAPQRPRGS